MTLRHIDEIIAYSFIQQLVLHLLEVTVPLPSAPSVGRPHFHTNINKTGRTGTEGAQEEDQNGKLPGRACLR